MLKKMGVTSIFKPGKMYKNRLDALLHAQTLVNEEKS